MYIAINRTKHIQKIFIFSETISSWHLIALSYDDLIYFWQIVAIALLSNKPIYIILYLDLEIVIVAEGQLY